MIVIFITRFFYFPAKKYAYYIFIVEACLNSVEARNFLYYILTNVN